MVMALDVTSFESRPLLFHPYSDLSPRNLGSVAQALSLRISGIDRLLRRTGPNAQDFPSASRSQAILRSGA